MSFKVSYVKGDVSYDSSSVAKIVNYPLEPRDYRPFAQDIIAISDSHLCLRMWAFEVSPLAGSRLEAVLYLFANAPDTALAVVAIPPSPDCEDSIGCCLLKDGAEVPVTDDTLHSLQQIALHQHNGEDLQGAYWGYTIEIPRAVLEELGGKLLLNVGDTFKGNFYKICADPERPHYGCFYPADFDANPYLLGSMGDFEVVAY